MLSDQFSPSPSSDGHDSQIRSKADAPSALQGSAQDESKQSSPNGVNETSGKGNVVAEPDKGFIDRAIDWVATNPGTALLIAAAIVGGGILIMRELERTPAADEVDGLPPQRKRKSRRSLRKKVTYTELV